MRAASERQSLNFTSGVSLSDSAKMQANRQFYTPRNPLLWSLLVLVWLCVGVCGVSSQEECLGLFDIYDQGVYVCRDHPDLVTALQIAEKMAREECQEAFHRERWNCSGFSLLNPPNITNRVTKEAAYVHALSLAAIAHSVAKVCALGDATSCTCEDEGLDLPESGGSTEYEMGCSDNVGFGINFATQFLRRRHSGSGLIQDIEAHNMHTGAKVVQNVDNIPYICRCVGVSGSCTLQTCQYELPEFGVLAKRIRDFYFHDHTCKVVWNNIIGPDSTHLPLSDCEDQSLIYAHNSPNYCIRNEAIGSLGTSGRVCDPHTTGSESCDYLCTQCGRSHVSSEEEVEENCLCEFVYCCEIRCSKCSVTRQYHVCT